MWMASAAAQQPSVLRTCGRGRDGDVALYGTAVTAITYYATITSNTMASSMCPVVHTVWSIYYLRFIIIPFPHFLL